MASRRTHASSYRHSSPLPSTVAARNYLLSTSYSERDRGPSPSRSLATSHLLAAGTSLSQTARSYISRPFYLPESKRTKDLVNRISKRMAGSEVLRSLPHFKPSKTLGEIDRENYLKQKRERETDETSTCATTTTLDHDHDRTSSSWLTEEEEDGDDEWEDEEYEDEEEEEDEEENKPYQNGYCHDDDVLETTITVPLPEAVRAANREPPDKEPSPTTSLNIIEEIPRPSPMNLILPRRTRLSVVEDDEEGEEEVEAEPEESEVEEDIDFEDEEEEEDEEIDENDDFMLQANQLMSKFQQTTTSDAGRKTPVVAENHRLSLPPPKVLIDVESFERQRTQSPVRAAPPKRVFIDQMPPAVEAKPVPKAVEAPKTPFKPEESVEDEETADEEWDEDEEWEDEEEDEFSDPEDLAAFQLVNELIRKYQESQTPSSHAYRQPVTGIATPAYQQNGPSTVGSSHQNVSASTSDAATRYKYLYEMEREENDKLRKRIEELSTKANETSSPPPALHNGAVVSRTPSSRSVSSVSVTSDDHEKRALERKIAQLEYELEHAKRVATESSRLKAENDALIRVLSKLSRNDRSVPQRRPSNFNPTTYG